MVDHVPSQRNSPCDSLSPLDDTAKGKMKPDQDMFGDVIGFIYREKLLDGAPEQTQPADDSTTCLDPTPLPEAIVPSSEIKTEDACSPRCPLITRTHRPSDLTLVRTNGLSTISTPDLRRRICDARTAPSATRLQVQVPRPKADHVPPTPGTPSPLFVMGNNPSSLVGLHPDDGSSLQSSASRVRAPLRMLRKSSANLLFNVRRPNSKSPFSSRLTTATVIRVQQQPSLSSLEATPEQSNEDSPMEDDQPSEPAQDVAVSHSPSTETIVRDDNVQDSDATPALPDATPTDHVHSEQDDPTPRKQSKSDSDLRKQAVLHRHTALSPSIPAPSPLPEDSPHKYGLKDRLDTPELPEVKNITVAPIRPRSSGPEIFHEAKSLQSASSFLNGLSTSRRRAESLQRSSESALTSQTATRRTGPKHRHVPPPSALPHTILSDRCREHNFKTSGFAYAWPLCPAQLKCYRNHMRLVPSSNKRCPVECAVCHIDDDREHFSCSWCALRMCRFCRKEFGENGMVGLKERIRQAELSGQSDGDVDAERLVDMGRPLEGRG